MVLSQCINKTRQQRKTIVEISFFFFCTMWHVGSYVPCIGSMESQSLDLPVSAQKFYTEICFSVPLLEEKIALQKRLGEIFWFIFVEHLDQKLEKVYLQNLGTLDTLLTLILPLQGNGCKHICFKILERVFAAIPTYLPRS